ncbi:MAG: fliO protein [Caulobacter sp.]|nr:fliO protein [Caulobacter sp.]
MDIVEFIRAVAALAVTLGLVGLVAVGIRRFGPETLARLAAGRRERRLKLVESLAIDPTRRLVVFSLDGEERLLLLGEGQLLSVKVKTPRPAKPSEPVV